MGYLKRTLITRQLVMVVMCATYMYGQTRPGDRPAPATRTYNKIGALNYGNNQGFLGNLMEPVTRYLAGRYDISIAGNSPLIYNSGMSSAAYQDMAAIYPNEVQYLFDSAEANNFYHEDIFLHMTANYSFNDSRYAWSGMQRFDAFEPVDGDHFINGAYSQSGAGALVDQTDAVWDRAVATDTPVADKLYVGYSEPFDEINVELRNSASGVAIAWEYWNGNSWSPLTLRSDGTNGLKANGKILFTPPGNWVKSAVVAGKRKKWWVRVVSTGSGTAPVVAAMYGDDWSVPGQSLTWRGWDRTNGNRLNTGMGSLEYNPNPPANATARFRYQARALGLWANNLAFLNLSNFQNGKRAAAKFLVDFATPGMQFNHYNALFMDDGLATPNTDAFVSPAGGWQANSEVANIDYFGHQLAALGSIRDYLHAAIPGSSLGVNSTIWAQVKNADFGFVEMGNEVHKGGLFYIPANDEYAWNSLTYDRLLPANNPTGVKGIFAAWDTRGSDFDWNGSFMTWDRGNRSPITALAAYYTVANENTRFSYNPGGWSYYLADGFQYVNEVPEYTLTGNVSVDQTGSAKSLFGDFRLFPSSYDGPW